MPEMMDEIDETTRWMRSTGTIRKRTVPKRAKYCTKTGISLALGRRRVGADGTFRMGQVEFWLMNGREVLMGGI
ncbi:MAG: hypothetical protein ABJA02_02160 [Acidobacteriota bacterium]